MRIWPTETNPLGEKSGRGRRSTCATALAWTKDEERGQQGCGCCLAWLAISVLPTSMGFWSVVFVVPRALLRFSDPRPGLAKLLAYGLVSEDFEVLFDLLARIGAL